MKYCEKCNKFYSEDKRYCSECGNVLIDKNKTKEVVDEKDEESFIEDLQIFGFEILLERFTLPIVISVSVVELIFFWSAIVIGIPKVMEGFWSTFILLAVIVAGVGYTREWLIKNYAGNSEMKTLGIDRSTWGSLEKAVSWIYPVVNILCIILCLRYAGEVLQLLEIAIDSLDFETLFNLWDFSEWKNLPELLNLKIWEELLIAVLRMVYKAKEWLILSQGMKLLWNIATVHREYDEDIKIGGVWKNIRKRILACLPKK